MYLDVPIHSKSGRISLVPPTEEDDAAVAALRSLPETRRFLRFMPHVCSVEDARARRRALAEEKCRVDFNIHATDAYLQAHSREHVPKLVGMTWIYRRTDDQPYGTHACEVSVIVHPAYFRGGMATDALYTVLEYVFEMQRCARVAFHTAVDNKVIRGWIERVGGRLEGIERWGWRDVAKEGNGEGEGYTDVCLYSILDVEWRGGGRERVESGGVVLPNSRM
ncbi:acyl-CoA N-acyltransferase [Mycena rebaudengoi]|nr:acyl-CoA N-acyltransferase [Mycena rebaudengoi]